MTNREKVFEFLDIYIECLRGKSDKELVAFMLEVGGLTGIVRDISQITGYSGLWIDQDRLTAWLRKEFNPESRAMTDSAGDESND